MDDKTLLAQYRFFLKDSIRKNVDFTRTDQARGVPPPPMEKPVSPDAKVIALVPPADLANLGSLSLYETIHHRASRRRFADEPLSTAAFSFLLWATQGVRRLGQDTPMFRTVPSAGARHALETYLIVRRVQELEEGVYRYLPLEHQLVLEFAIPDLAERVTASCFGQAFVGKAAVVFAWAAVPYRMEWRYGLASHKVIAIDAGHVAQNLYLACEAIGAATCAVGAYDQEAMDALLRLDGKDEFTLYVAPVGVRK